MCPLQATKRRGFQDKFRPQAQPFTYLHAMRIYLLLFLGIAFYASRVSAQCSQTITTFPYHEDFEGSDGGWSAGGTGSDWTLGTPDKAVINSAGNGLTSWVTGGLTASFYNFGQRSSLESPCFDFTTLTRPYIYFKIWWETEQRYDGANLQYSLNGGTSWTNVGGINDAVNCLNENWYNYNSVTNLNTLATVRNGWTGNIQPTSGSCQGGFGSNGWVVAKHCMPYLAGKPSVKFRFTFGAGTTCNDFDGFAFDDIYIENAPPIAASFVPVCAGDKTYTFSDSSTYCPDTWNWNFGEPASGAANTSTFQNPSHTYSTPGVYTVTFTAGSLCSGTATTTQTVTILGATAVTTPVSCQGGNNGSATVQVMPANGNLTYSWSIVPAQSGATATNLSAGTYTVSVSSSGGCPTTTTITITEPAALQHTTSTIDATCGKPNGSATIAATGGTLPYTYVWSPSGGTNASATSLLAGNYTITITDQQGCTDLASATISDTPPVQTTIGLVENVSCFGSSDGQATSMVTGGTAPVTYAWSPAGGTSATAAGLAAGTYQVVVTDAKLCTATALAVLTQPTALTYTATTTPATCGGSDGSATVITSGGTAPYTYNWVPSGSTASTATGLLSGNYNVTVTDTNGCTDVLAVNVGNVGGLQATVSSTTGVRCFGEQTGSATVTASGGTLPYTYQWSPAGGTTATASGLAAGNYFVTVVDANQCVAAVATVITQPQALQYALAAQPIRCFGERNGALTVSSSGGVAPYLYQWSTGETAATASDLAADGYAVTITDASGCRIVTDTFLSQPTRIVSRPAVISVRCHNEANGTIYIDTTFGGSAPYLYALNQGNFATIAAFTGLKGGNYVLFTQDANGCLVIDSVEVKNPAVNTVFIGNDTLINIGDSILLDAVLIDPGGVAHFAWTPAVAVTCDTCVPTFVRPFVSTVYTLMVTDTSGCVTSDARRIAVNGPSVYIPNVFKPGASGYENDHFTLYAGFGIAEIEMLQVYDRWGGLVFERRNFQPSDPNMGWDGRIRGEKAAVGVYAYASRVRWLDGTSVWYKGDVTLLK